MIVHQPTKIIQLEDDTEHGIRGRADEHFHSLLRSLGWPAATTADQLTLLGFTSCARGEGVSTVAMQTAIAAAEPGESKVLVVDARLAEPSVHKSLSVARYPGIADLISLGAEPQSCIRKSRFANVWVLPAGQCEGNAAHIYGSIGRLRDLAGLLRRSFDLVLFDLPPMGDSDAAMQLVTMLDGVVLVVESQRVRSDTAERVALRLQRAGAKLKGVVLNKYQDPLPSWLDRKI